MFPYLTSIRISSILNPAALVAEECIEGDCLSDVWRNFAEIIVELGESTFDGIGGLKLDGGSANCRRDETIQSQGKLFEPTFPLSSSRPFRLKIDPGDIPSLGTLQYRTMTKQYVLSC